MLLRYAAALRRYGQLSALRAASRAAETRSCPWRSGLRCSLQKSVLAPDMHALCKASRVGAPSSCSCLSPLPARTRAWPCTLFLPQESIATNFGDFGTGSTTSALQGATFLTRLGALELDEAVPHSYLQRGPQRLRHIVHTRIILLVAEVGNLTS